MEPPGRKQPLLDREISRVEDVRYETGLGRRKMIYGGVEAVY